MSHNKLTSSPSFHRPLLDGNETSVFCAYVYVRLIGITFIMIISSLIGQEAAFSVDQNSDRFEIKFSIFGDYYYVRTVNIATF